MTTTVPTTSVAAWVATIQEELLGSLDSGPEGLADLAQFAGAIRTLGEPWTKLAEQMRERLRMEAGMYGDSGLCEGCLLTGEAVELVHVPGRWHSDPGAVQDDFIYCPACESDKDPEWGVD